MKISVEDFSKSGDKSPLFVIFSDKSKPFGSIPAQPSAWNQSVREVLAAMEKKTFKGDSEFFPGERNLLVTRVSVKKGLDRFESLRLAAGTVLETAKSRTLPQISISLDKADAPEIRSIIEGLLYCEYDFRKYKSEPPKSGALPDVVLLVKAKDLKPIGALANEITTVFSHMRELRNWVNEPGSELDPAAFAEIARSLGKKHGLQVTVRDEKQLLREGFLGLCTVGKGSDRPPRMVTLRYTGRPKAKNHLCLVGKGVTFDTGGISLKPSANMGDMKCDMAGAATVLAAICAAAELKIPVNLSAILCLAENRPGNGSVLPGDIFKARNGKTVMVDNTDAEGRLVLSDGLFEAGALQATHIIDLATLTGSVVRALGSSVAGLFSNTKAFANSIHKTGLKQGEKFWELPMEEEYREWLDDTTADLRNSTSKPEAGAITAALFLAEFVPEKTQWAHWDVAGTAFVTGNWKYFKPGATGFGLKTLIEIAKQLAF